MSVENIITEKLDIWTSAVKTKSASGRGSSKKLELYGIKKLRELILELAIRGKLVVQDSKNEPASELLKMISAEREQLVKDKKIKSQKYRTIDEIPFELPKSWIWTRLPEVAFYKPGKTPPTKEASYWEEGNTAIPWVSISDMDDQGTIKDTIRRVSQRAKEKVFKSDLVPSGTMLMSFKLTVGKVSVLGVDSFHNEAIISIYPFSGVSQQYLMRVLPKQSNAGNKKQAIKGNTLNSESLADILIPLPPLEEQKRINVKIDELMTLCDQLESQTEASIEAHQTLVKSLLETLTIAKDADELNESWQRISAHFDVLFTTEDSIDQLKQTILQLAVMGKLVKQDPKDEPTPNLLKRMVGEEVYKARNKNMSHTIAKEHISFELPSGWSFGNIEQLLDGSRKGMITGPFGSALKKSEHKESGIPVWGIESVKKGKFTGINKIFVDGEKAKELSSFKAIQGDLIISRSGTIDEICVIPDGVEDGLISTNLLRVTLDKKLIEPEFFCFTFKGSEIVLNKIKDMCSGTTRLFLNQKILKSITFPVPPLCEQKKIICKVEELFTVCEEVKAKVRKANDLQNFLADSISSSFVN